MSILTLAEAQRIDPTVDQLRLDALEEMVRARTANRFHRGHSVGAIRLSGDDLGESITLTSASGHELPPFQEGDTVELVDCGYADGLYAVTGVSGSGSFTLEGAKLRAPGTFHDGRACLVMYPADVVGGVKSLLEYTKTVRSLPVGVESRTVSRVTEKYSGKLTETTAGTYPEELLGFLTAHRQLSWGA